MLLVIDVGNTETVIGLYAPDGGRRRPGARGEHRRRHRDRARPDGAARADPPLAPLHRPSRTPDEHAVLLTQLLDLEGLDISTSVSGIAVCSSVPHVTAELRQMASRWFSDLPSVVLGPGTKSGMPILYDNPKEVGADRIADAVGAYDLYGGPCVVVDMGTATTVEAISANGEYMGGAITPGVGVSLDALYQSAAALRRVELVEPRSVIGRSTVESIESGTLYGFAGLVDSLARRFMEELGPSTVVATGGFSSLIAPYSDTIEHVEPWLTLHGLRIVYERNVPS